MKRLYIACLLLSAFLTGCMQPISSQSRALVDPTISFAALREKPDAYLGRTLVLGGMIISQDSSTDVSQLAIAELPVDAEGFPDVRSPSSGRFLAESMEYLDASLYTPRRIVTLVGEVKGKKSVQIDGKTDHLPVIAIKEIHLWDYEKFQSRPQRRDDNPYADTYERPMAERPLEPMIDPKRTW